MRQDLVTIVILLLAAVATYCTDRHRRPYHAIVSKVVQTGRFVFSPSSWRPFWHYPLTRVVLLLVSFVCVGWAATLTQTGFETMRKAIDFQSLDPIETANCYAIQEMVIEDIVLWSKQENIPLKPGPIDRRYMWDCQFGGNFYFDASGILHCSKHGSKPEQVSVFYSQSAGEAP